MLVAGVGHSHEIQLRERGTDFVMAFPKPFQWQSFYATDFGIA